jgi:ATP-dependent helicase STH1/SNF2
MQEIQARISSSYYKSISDFKADFQKVFANAQEYNQEGSQVWYDAEVLKTVFKNALEAHSAEMGFGNGDAEGKRKREEDEDSVSFKRLKE